MDPSLLIIFVHDHIFYKAITSHAMPKRFLQRYFFFSHLSVLEDKSIDKNECKARIHVAT